MICFLWKTLVCWTTISLDGRHVRIARAGRLLLSGCWTGWIVAVNFLQSLLWDALSKAGEAKHFPADLGTWVEHWNMSLIAQLARRPNEGATSSAQFPIQSDNTILRSGTNLGHWEKKKNRDRGGSIRQHPNKNKSSTDLKCIHKSEICRQHVDSM